jgi:glycosyltransferase involved in cell wall biosynthesis
MAAGIRLEALPPLVGDPFVSVIMPVRNEGRFIEQSFGAVFSQDFPVDRFEIIVSDGESDDDTLARIDRLVEGRRGPSVRVVNNPRRTAPAALNVGLAAARGDLIVRIDGHSEVPPSFLRDLVELSRSTSAACVGGRVTTVGENDVARAIAAAQSSRFGVGGVSFRHATEPGPVDTVLFGAYRREVFDVIGDFDETLVRNQDDEFNLRLVRAGGVVWMDPSVTFLHYARSSFGSLWRQYEGYGRYKPMVMRKHHVVVAPRHLVPAAFVVATVGSLALGAFTRRPLLAGAVLGPYLAGTAANAIAVSRESKVSPLDVAVATAVLHVSYGVGMLRGLVHT